MVCPKQQGAKFCQTLISTFPASQSAHLDAASCAVIRKDAHCIASTANIGRRTNSPRAGDRPITGARRVVFLLHHIIVSYNLLRHERHEPHRRDQQWQAGTVKKAAPRCPHQWSNKGSGVPNGLHGRDSLRVDCQLPSAVWAYILRAEASSRHLPEKLHLSWFDLK